MSQVRGTWNLEIAASKIQVYNHSFKSQNTKTALPPKLFSARPSGPVFGPANCAPLLFRNRRPDPFLGPPDGLDFGSARCVLFFSFFACIKAAAAKMRNFAKATAWAQDHSTLKKNILTTDTFVHNSNDNSLFFPQSALHAPHWQHRFFNKTTDPKFGPQSLDFFPGRTSPPPFQRC